VGSLDTMKFVTLRLDTGPPNGIIELEMPAATSLRYAGLRFGEYLGLDTDQFFYFLMDSATKEPCPTEHLAADYDGTVFVLGCRPLGH